MTPTEHSILLVEDADSLREVLSCVLQDEGYRVTACENAEKGVEALSQGEFSLILSDFRLPGMDGLQFLEATRQRTKSTPFLIMTAFGSVDIAVEAMKTGANDFITKPFEPEQITQNISQMISHRQLLDRKLGKSQRRKRSFITKDPATINLLKQAERVAKFASSVLILGESGTGKELIARYIHEQSSRSDQVFVTVNCGALPEALLESELFGHETGAFTGATQTRIGLFEVAKAGTIFLDEIGEMPISLQVKLLRALQEKEIKRVGGNNSIEAAPRIITATNRSISEAIEQGLVREDLYYRIGVIELELNALRDRPGDIKILADYFLENFSPDGSKCISDDAYRDLEDFSWPGNARELENTIERATLLSQELILPEHLGLSGSDSKSKLSQQSANATLPELVQEAAQKVEREVIQEALKKYKGNKSRVAQALGVSYKTLLNKVRDYSL